MTVAMKTLKETNTYTNCCSKTIQPHQNSKPRINLSTINIHQTSSGVRHTVRWWRRPTALSRVSPHRQAADVTGNTPVCDAGYMSRKIQMFRTDKFDEKQMKKFDSCSLCKRLVPSRLHELHGLKLSFVSLSNLSILNFRNFLFMYPGSVTTGQLSAINGPLRWPVTGLL